MLSGAVVCVHHVTGTAAARAVIAGLVIRAGKRQQRVEQPSFLQAEEHRISSQLGPKSPLAQLDLGLACVLFRVRVANLRTLPASTLKHPQHVSRLRDFPPRQRFKVRQDAFALDFLSSRSRECCEPLRLAVRTIAFPEMRGLPRKRAVVVQRGAPEHCAVSHHAGLDFSHFGRVASRYAASFFGYPKIARIYEANVVP